MLLARDLCRVGYEQLAQMRLVLINFYWWENKLKHPVWQPSLLDKVYVTVSNKHFVDWPL